MRVFVANFGLKNYEWPECLRRGTIAVMNHPDHHRLWKERDFAGFVASSLKHRTYKGKTPNRAVVERWYVSADIFAESSGDLWIHRANGEVWWTISTSAGCTEEDRIEPRPSGRPTVVSHKPCEPWRNHDRKGKRLAGDNLHPRDLKIFINPQTVVELKGVNAAYARALVEGTDLSLWRDNPDWHGPQTRRTRAAARKWADSFSFDAAHRRMVQTAFDTAARSNGQQVLRTVKNKKVVELTREELDRYSRDLFAEQEGLCRLTGLKLQHDDGPDPALRCSLDRIDSSGHYQKSNLQIVCRFANFWKRDTGNTEFLRLVRLLREQTQG